MRPTMTSPAPNLPARPLEPDTCIRCGRRLIVTRTKQGHVREAVHENGSIRCLPPAAHRCDVCTYDSLMQCGVSGCSVLAHPTCLTSCSGCGRLCCPSHALDMPEGPMCPNCADHHHTAHQEAV